jgi:hypothetical protein
MNTHIYICTFSLSLFLFLLFPVHLPVRICLTPRTEALKAVRAPRPAVHLRELIAEHLRTTGADEALLMIVLRRGEGGRKRSCRARTAGRRVSY